MTIDTEALRDQLRDFRSRSAAIDEAASAGADALEPAVELLADRSDSVRWSAIRILAEIGDERAVGPLVGLLERGRNTTDAANALRAVTGQDLGDDPTAWRAWMSNAGATDDSWLSDEELIAAATRGLDAAYTAGERPCGVTVSLADGRKQSVWIDFDQTDGDGEPIVQLCTACGPARSEHYEWALKLNMSIPYGAIGVASLDDSYCFALVDAYARATVDPEEIAKSLVCLAAQGDAIEKALTEGDQY